MSFIIKVSRLHVGGIALFPFIFISKKAGPARIPALLNHERIHIRQQAEMLVIPFFLVYLAHYLWNLIRYRDHRVAYRNIIFEREAFCEEGNEGYLKSRKPWNFLRY